MATRTPGAWHVVMPDGDLHHHAEINGKVRPFDSAKIAARYITEQAQYGTALPAAAREEVCTCDQ